MDNYDSEIKTIEEVKERFPAYEGKFSRMPFFSVVEKFKKEEYKELHDDAKFYKDKLTPAKLKQFEEIAYAKAVYRFCFGWENAIEQVHVQFGLAGKAAGMRAISVIDFMLRQHRDPFAQDRETVGKFIEQYMCRHAAPAYTDEEALRDIEGEEYC